MWASSGDLLDGVPLDLAVNLGLKSPPGPELAQKFIYLHIRPMKVFLYLHIRPVKVSL